MSSELTLASIQDLHVDMIVAIFARLGLRDLCNIELVCKRWREVARLAWSTRSCIRLNRQTLARTSSPLAVVGRRSLNRTMLDKHALDKFIAAKSIGLALTRLELSSLFFNPLSHKKTISLAALAQHCPNLEHLDLSCLEVSGSSLLEVAQGCRKLHTLIFDECTGFGDAAIAQMFKYCTQLARFDISNCEKITGECLKMGGPVALRRLSIENCRRVSDESLCEMFTHNVELTHLNLERRTSKSTIECMVSKLKSLVDLRIEVDAKQLSELLHEYVEQEEAANVCNADGAVNSDFVDSNNNNSRCARPPLFEHLTSLSIFGTRGANLLDDPRLISYVLTHAHRLNSLRLQQLSIEDDELTHRQLLIGAPLEQLTLCQLDVTDATIDVMCKQLAASLRSLTLQACENLTRQGIDKAIGELTRLKRLDLLDLPSQVDNWVLERTASVAETRRTQLFLTCSNTDVDSELFVANHEGAHRNVDGVYVYKNIEWSSVTF